MLQAIEKNLTRGIKLLENISDEEYSNTTIAPYYSSIGGHTRHILDVFDCIFEGLQASNVNLIKRKRNTLVENKTAEGIQYFKSIISKLESIENHDLNEIIQVTDDLGEGVVTANYTIASVLIQAHSHAIHHFASVGYVISQLGIDLPDEDFGFNPTTPKKN
ncbi:DinB family protein [Lutibacter sp. TH_r2]|uniref:DinB family protein n=1 Tax=Lutibacter sp. TH_r2 TaxID=3082083 RepID=UPI0029551319|nr:DinB family protein [Lutibacter sp. TH_r2]MDV7185648.1 DinB family protein [Lutibacter sp. TH_r2]